MTNLAALFLYLFYIFFMDLVMGVPDWAAIFYPGSHKGGVALFFDIFSPENVMMAIKFKGYVKR